MSDTHVKSLCDAGNAGQQEWLVSFKRNDGCARFQTVSATCETSAEQAARSMFVVPAAWKLINAVPITDDDRLAMDDISWWTERTHDEIEEDEYDRQKAMFNAE